MKYKKNQILSTILSLTQVSFIICVYLSMFLIEISLELMSNQNEALQAVKQDTNTRLEELERQFNV